MGWIGSKNEGNQAILVNAPSTCAQMVMEKLAQNVAPDYWTVQPVGLSQVAYTEGGKVVEDIFVVCRFIASREVDEARDWRRASEKKHLKKNSSATLLPGLGGVYITRAEFDLLTSDGCCVCSETITPSDADSMFWAESDDSARDPDPVCPACAVGLLSPDTYDLRRESGRNTITESELMWALMEDDG
jgi:hypothetical protein